MSQITSTDVESDVGGEVCNEQGELLVNAVGCLCCVLGFGFTLSV